MARPRTRVPQWFRDACYRNPYDEISVCFTSDSDSEDDFYPAVESLSRYSKNTHNPMGQGDSGYITATEEPTAEFPLTRYGSPPHSVIPLDELPPPRPWIASSRQDSGVSGMSTAKIGHLYHRQRGTNNSTQSLDTNRNDFNDSPQGGQSSISQHREEITANTETLRTSQIRENLLQTSHTINLPTTEGLRRSKTSANSGRKRNHSYTRGYSIDDSAQAFKGLEEEHEKRVNAILDGHLEKLFKVDLPETIQKVGAVRTVQVVRPRARTPLGQEAMVEDVGQLRTLKQRIKGKWRDGVRKLKEIGEEPKPRGRARTRRFTLS